MDIVKNIYLLFSIDLFCENALQYEQYSFLCGFFKRFLDKSDYEVVIKID